MQKKIFIKLSNLAVPFTSNGRFNKEKKTSLRNDFQRDRDRIIHSTAFRRLKHKTQVFVNTSGDHFRTRITHSLEVSQIARTLSKFFNLNEDDAIFDNTIIDKASLEIISGSIVDFRKEMIGESFVIKNPKATASCGCGLSFSI